MHGNLIWTRGVRLLFISHAATSSHHSMYRCIHSTNIYWVPILRQILEVTGVSTKNTSLVLIQLLKYSDLSEPLCHYPHFIIFIALEMPQIILPQTFKRNSLGRAFGSSHHAQKIRPFMVSPLSSWTLLSCIVLFTNRKHSLPSLLHYPLYIVPPGAALLPTWSTLLVFQNPTFILFSWWNLPWNRP